jgi:hypothetical protein
VLLIFVIYIIVTKKNHGRHYNVKTLYVVQGGGISKLTKGFNCGCKKKQQPILK